MRISHAWRGKSSTGDQQDFQFVGMALVCMVLLVSSPTVATVQAQDVPPEVTVYMNRTCGCCKKWVNHLESNGFKLVAVDVANLRAVKDSLRVPIDLASCHTAVVEGYVIEGHVPADLIRRLLEQGIEVAGLAVPGMPIGSPGMEGPNPERFDVVSFQEDGSRAVFASRGPTGPNGPAPPQE